MKIENFSQLNEYLKQFVPGSIMDGDFYNPDKMYDLLKCVGDPQKKLKVVHVAGTSGKTSTSYYLAAMLAKSSKKVGLSVSPHIFEVNERVQINGEPLSEQQMCKFFSEFIAIDGLVDLRPTYFEMLVTFAFWVFARAGCTYAVMEVGLGGLKDATNVIDDPNKVAVITDIGLDHTRILGDTIEQIAVQKAGIIKQGNHVFCYEQNETVDEIIDDQVKKAHAHLQRYKQDEFEDRTTFVDGLPDYQKRNWLLARQVVEYIAERDELQVPNDALQKTQETEIPARMQRLIINNKLVILDGAHNPQKLSVLTSSLKVLYPNKTFAILVAFVSSKESTLPDNVKKLKELSDNIIVTEFTLTEDLVHASIPAGELGTVFKDAQIIPDAQKAFNTLLNQTEDILLITGSFYLIASLHSKMRQYAHG